MSRGARAASRGRSASPPQARRTAERLLLGAIQAGVALLLLTPLVVTTQTAFPWVVGKALFARGTIEVLFVLWAALALLNPTFRPPRSRLLALLVVGFACSLAATPFGVSPMRSVWSNYERMQGLVDALHWIALIVVLAAAYRHLRQLLMALYIHLGVSVIVVLLAFASYHELPLPFYGALREHHPSRIGGVLGNALFLGGYAAVNGVLAIGLCCHSWLASTRKERGAWPIGAKRAATMLFLAFAAYLNIHVLALTEAISAWLSLAAAALVAALAFAIWTRSRPWRNAVAATAIAGLLCGGAALALPQVGGKVVERFVAVVTDESGQQRAAALVAAVAAFADRPLVGFGPENFIVAWGRHVDTTASEAHDSAHNRTFEEAATKGLFGIGAYIALWAFAYFVLARRAKAADRNEGTLLLTLGAALTCFFLNDQLRFPTAVLNLQQVLLFALIVQLERPPHGSDAAGRLDALFGRASMRAGVAVAALALATAGLHLNITMYAAASDIAKVGRPGRPGAYLERAIERFEPLANTPRLILIEQLAENWRVIRVRESAEALRLLAFVEKQARLALDVEPENWQIHHALARLHTEVARGDPAHQSKAAHHLAKSKELAPNVPLRLISGW